MIEADFLMTSIIFYQRWTKENQPVCHLSFILDLLTDNLKQNVLSLILGLKACPLALRISFFC